MSKIDEALGLIPFIPSKDISQYTSKPDDSQQKNDLEFVRETLYDAVTKSQAAVEDMIQIAQQSQHPKAYEVLNSLIKTFADVSSGIADLQLKKQRLEDKNRDVEDLKTVHNNLFVGSTADLQKMLQDLKSSDA